MTSTATALSSKSKRRQGKPTSDARKPIASRQPPPAAASTTTVPRDQSRVTKQELVLTLLNRSDGSCVCDHCQHHHCRAC